VGPRSMQAYVRTNSCFNTLVHERTDSDCIHTCGLDMLMTLPKSDMPSSLSPRLCQICLCVCACARVCVRACVWAHMCMCMFVCLCAYMTIRKSALADRNMPEACEQPAHEGVAGMHVQTNTLKRQILRSTACSALVFLSLSGCSSLRNTRSRSSCVGSVSS